jgi:hypothetical protein
LLYVGATIEIIDRKAVLKSSCPEHFEHLLSEASVQRGKQHILVRLRIISAVGTCL